MATLPASANLISLGNRSNAQAQSRDHNTSQQIVETGVMESQQTHALSDEESEWHPFATFTAELQQRRVEGQTEYRTVVSHREAGSGAYWPGMESARLHQWIISQLQPLIQSEDRTMMQADFEAESRHEPEAKSRQKPEAGTPSKPEAKSEPEPQALILAASAVGDQLESATEGQPEVETTSQPALAAEVQLKSEALAQPEAIEGRLESVTEGQPGAETSPQPAPTAEVQSESEAIAQPQAIEGRLESVTEGQPAVETAPQPTLATEVQPEAAEGQLESDAFAQPQATEDQLEPTAEAPSAVETESQPTLQPQPEALAQPELATEKSPEPVSELKVEPEETIQPLSVAAAPPQTEAEAEVMARSGEEATPTAVEIIQLKAAQPPQSGMPIMFERARPLTMKSIRSGYPFALEVSFKLSGPGADGAAKEQASYHAEFYAYNRTTGETLSLGKAPGNTLVDGELAYTSRLSEAMLQKPGMYRLQVVTELDNGLASPDYYEVPLLKVV